MKRLTRWGLVLALVLAGCGGGGGVFVSLVGSGGTGISGGGVGSGGTGSPASSIGSVAGFGSIIVNGVRFDTEYARIVLADSDSLKLGMTVAVAGSIEADLVNGTALEVVSAAELRGPVADLDAGAGRFSVLSVTVQTDDATVFAGGLADAGDLRSGDAVQVHGLPGEGAKLRATRVERLPAAGSPVLTGPIDALDTAARTLRIGGKVVRYGGALFLANWPAGNLAVGQLVRVRATALAPVLDAASIEPWYLAGTPDGARLTLAGLVTSFSGPSSLRVDGVPVDASRARVQGGSLASLAPGVPAEVTGTVVSGVLLADRIRLRPQPSLPSPADAFSASGTASSFRSAADFKIRGQEIDASGATYVGGTQADLESGRKVRVTGPRVVDDVLQASRVEFLAD